MVTAIAIIANQPREKRFGEKRGSRGPSTRSPTHAAAMYAGGPPTRNATHPHVVLGLYGKTSSRISPVKIAHAAVTPAAIRTHFRGPYCLVSITDGS